MLLQLLLIGYVLLILFESEHVVLVSLVLVVMIIVSSWIALRPIAAQRRRLYPVTLMAIAVAGLPVLFLTTQWVLDITPWYAPRYMIPLAGMIFATAMNSVSIAAERYVSEFSSGLDHVDARRKTFEAALIPLINSLLAVGLVSLPGDDRSGAGRHFTADRCVLPDSGDVYAFRIVRHCGRLLFVLVKTELSHARFKGSPIKHTADSLRGCILASSGLEA